MTTNNSASQAKAQLENIIAMVKRLEHAQECDGEDCEDWEAIYEPISAGIGIADYHDSDAAGTAIQEDALSVEVRSDWHTPGERTDASEYKILLCWGGPAVRIIGNLDEYGEPDSARLEHQDWGTEWTTADIWTEQRNAETELLIYARQFYFGE